MEQKYYKVTAKCGHVGGRNYYIPIDFYVACENGRQAAATVREKPRVKHDDKRAILSVQVIDYDEYIAGQNAYFADPYIRSSNRQQQAAFDDEILLRVLPEDNVPTYLRKERGQNTGKTEQRPNRKRSVRYGWLDNRGYDYDGEYEAYTVA